MRTPKILLTSATIVISFIAVSRPATAGAPKDRIPRAVKCRQQQTQSIQKQLANAHGDDAWYVFQVVGFRPSARHSITRVTNGVWSRGIAISTVTSQLESKAFKVGGPTAAAEIIWCGNHSPVRFIYWTFQNEHDADAFYRSLQY